ncbi:MAG: hypothetical protein COW59_09505 [Lysobacterales bacterium CG17_big_fil_post_rev_8_21_14_2_50_64_11]|nr:MAG: hypothetical protein COW59_09505 [Xanthomonadales bacterium CG17_big_fil_post_rev_8_21_14_2_50_64_11]PIX60208.1 MAG: hypothetical protein COZ47_08430 [Xanthomonadales bacterium CG_4_10_14_3_um_filter_64_11]
MVSAWLLGALLPAVAADGQWLAWEGTAREPQSQEVLYAEQHWLRVRDGMPIERLVLYRCPEGGAFARKHVDYRPSRIAPAFALEDARSGYREGLSYDADGTARVFFRASANTAAKSAALSAEALVADAGFDEFIRLHWDRLLAGEPLTLAFAVPARRTSYRFTTRYVADSADDAGLATFRLRLYGPLKWLAPAIEVSYRRDSRQLVRFRGLANLRDERGEQVQAWIDFPEPARRSSPRAAAMASASPLLACNRAVAVSSAGQRPRADTPSAAQVQ